MLKTETDTPEMGQRVLAAAIAKLSNCYDAQPLDLQVNFEHGQWWVTNPVTGAQWSVVDAEGPGVVDGFDFEMVTEPDEDCEFQVRCLHGAAEGNRCPQTYPDDGNPFCPDHRS